MLALVSVFTYVRGVDRVEVAGTILFMPIFVALVFWDLKGGLIAGVLAGIAYTVLRLPAIDQVGAGEFAPTIVSRALAFLAFGGIGGWASLQLERSLVKLDLYDQIDDATGLFNARFLLQDTDLETSRSRRYQTIFSVTAVEFPESSLDKLPRKKATRAIRDLGRLIGDSVRTVDRAVHGRGDGKHIVAVILPETGPEGSHIFAERLRARVGEFIVERGGTVGDSLRSRVVTFPDDEAGLAQLRLTFTAIDAADHPETAVENGGPRDGGPDRRQP